MDKVVVTQADGDLLIKVSRLVATMHMGLATEKETADRALADIARHRIEAQRPLLEALETARDALHQHYVAWDGEPEDAAGLQLARSACDAAIKQAKGE